MNDKFIGISGLVRATIWFEDCLDLQTLSISRAALQRKDSFTLETCGKFLFYSITIDGGFTNLDVTPMDQAEESQRQRLLTIGDTKAGMVRSLPVGAGSGTEPDQGCQCSPLGDW
jgi:hypothetical protein